MYIRVVIFMLISSAFRVTAAFAGQTTFLVNQGFFATTWTRLFGYLRTIRNVFFQGTFHTDFPGVNGFAVELQAGNQFDNLIEWHAIT